MRPNAARPASNAVVRSLTRRSAAHVGFAPTDARRAPAIGRSAVAVYRSATPTRSRGYARVVNPTASQPSRRSGKIRSTVRRVVQVTRASFAGGAGRPSDKASPSTEGASSVDRASPRRRATRSTALPHAGDGSPPARRAVGAAPLAPAIRHTWTGRYSNATAGDATSAAEGSTSGCLDATPTARALTTSSRSRKAERTRPPTSPRPTTAATRRRASAR